MSYADDMQAVSVGQALIYVSSTVENTRRHAAAVNRDAARTPGLPKELAETIRAKVRNATCCEGARLSIGYTTKLDVIFKSKHWNISRRRTCVSPRAVQIRWVS
jgi:hypothetical protein